MRQGKKVDRLMNELIKNPEILDALLEGIEKIWKEVLALLPNAKGKLFLFKFL